MQGEFRGDFTRDTFRPEKNFSRVLMQQGRVLLDADWNEQASIFLHYVRRVAGDLIGPHGGPDDLFAAGNKLVQVNCGFEIITDSNQINALPLPDDKKKALQSLLAETKSLPILIGQGRYYVGGLLCENRDYCLYSAQPHFSGDDQLKLTPGTNYLAYLDVWERHVSCIQDADAAEANPSIREVALGGPDTASRSQVVWQVKIKETAITANKAKNDYEAFLSDLNEPEPRLQPGSGRLRARARRPESDAEDCACITSPESRFRGVENQLYRVEIQKPGVLWNGLVDNQGKPAGNISDAATFAWSRENASVTFPISRANGNQVTVTNLGLDERRHLNVGDWVEVVDDSTVAGKASPLLQVSDINEDTSSLILSGPITISVNPPLTSHPFLRRWDSRDVAVVQVPVANDGWIALEQGVEIQFNSDGRYQAGDYWLIPARAVTGDVEWPGPVKDPGWLPPHGIQHYYAPLAVLSGAGGWKDCRRRFTTLAK